jgi:hypothetical protein
LNTYSLSLVHLNYVEIDKNYLFINIKILDIIIITGRQPVLLCCADGLELNGVRWQTLRVSPARG